MSLQKMRELLPENVWVTQVRPDSEAPGEKLTLIGSFFKDNLYGDITLPDNQPIVQFVERLQESDLFSEETQFALSITDLATAQDDPQQSIAVFQVDITLSTPVKL
jgi:Tfp pilus assembly protein PilN